MLCIRRSHDREGSRDPRKSPLNHSEARGFFYRLVSKINNQKGFSVIRTRLICFFVLILSPALTLAQHDITKTRETNLRPISSQAFHGFERCEISSELSEALDKLIAEGKPLNKEEGVWIYAIKSQVMGLPIEAIKIGVCDATGERALIRKNKVGRK